MKEIIFIRHAKSSWNYDVSDRERPLKKRGINDSHLVSNSFKQYGFIPDAIFTSPARRARKTCKIFTENLNISVDDIKVQEDIYDFGGNMLISFIKSLDKELNRVMIFGHNHAFTSVVNVYGSKYIDNVPTSGLVKIVFDIDDWNAIKKGVTTLTIFPRDLK
ncbi:histidine phosphatase family protein [Pontimicrobium sp. SW4]|uniref:Histidine phosphatase family protein n=1 Tax=Pontimicrobium sp. SW4 TaxID=3153519 RepID=A0AAU7BWW3_9FLAO